MERAQMRTKTSFLAWTIAGLTSAGCPGDDPGAASSNGDGNQTEAASFTSSPGDGDETGSDGGTEETGTDDGTSATTHTFIVDNDGGPPEFECDPWAQDCPADQKCMPWDNTGSGSWNATKCTPLNPNPAQPGDDCTVEGSGISGVDNCGVASMCWAVDPETNVGTCVSFCSGNESNPSCDDPNTTCSITNGGALILCLPSCDPLLQSCADGQGCYPISNAFVCVPNASPTDGGNYGDACEYANVCNPGLFCAPASAVPNCQGSTRCCTEFCDVGDPGATAACSGVAGGQECLPLFEQGQAPPGYEDVGACAIPS
jgi:hypothetical protein